MALDSIVIMLLSLLLLYPPDHLISPCPHSHYLMTFPFSLHHHVLIFPIYYLINFLFPLSHHIPIPIQLPYMSPFLFSGLLKYLLCYSRSNFLFSPVMLNCLYVDWWMSEVKGQRERSGFIVLKMSQLFCSLWLFQLTT